jgi:hypothetical protein
LVAAQDGGADVKRFALTLLLLCGPAAAQDMPVESVTSYGSSLVGVWYGTLGQSGFYGLFGALTGLSAPVLGEMANGFCRIAPAKDELEMSCMQFGGNSRVTLEDGHVRIGNSRLAFVGDQPDAMHLRGHFRGSSWLGVSTENPATAEAVRITPQVDAPDKADQAPLLRRILDEGLAGVPRDAAAMKKNGSIISLPKLGAIQTIAYLGQETKWDWPPPPGVKADRMHIPNRPDFFSVYFVRFAQGERLCGLHQRADGMLDAFRCA